MMTDGTRAARTMPPIHVDRDGAWAWEGRPLVHEQILAYLKQNLERDADGAYWVAVDGARVKVEVADAPYVVEALLADPPRIRLDDATEEPLPEPLVVREDADHRLHVRVKGGRERALLSRSAHQQVWAALSGDGDAPRLTLGARTVRLEIEPVD